MSRTRIVIESPYKGATPKELGHNIVLAQRACRWAIDQGYNPYASHLFFPQMLDDISEEERRLGIELGLAWSRNAREAWFVLRDTEVLSQGMRLAHQQHTMDYRHCRYFRTSDNGETLREVPEL